METINSRFRNALELTTALVEHLSKFQNIKILVVNFWIKNNNSIKILTNFFFNAESYA